MKKKLLLIPLALFLAISLFPIGCEDSVKDTSSKLDLPQFSRDEVIAIVKRDLLEQKLDSKDIVDSYNYHDVYYQHNGKWSGYCTIVTEGIIESSSERPKLERPGVQYAIVETIQWNFYEKSQTVEIE